MEGAYHCSGQGILQFHLIHSKKLKMERTLLRTTEEQKQELQSQQEELRVTNEELEEQTERLRLSEDRFKTATGGT